jgi:hypothetical protein
LTHFCFRTSDMHRVCLRITTINQIGSAGSTLHDKMYEFFFNLGVLSPESQENM